MRKKKRVKLKIKRVILVFVVILILITIGISVYLYNQKTSIILVDNLTASYNSTVTNLSFIKEVKNGKIISEEENIDTSKIGTIEVVIEIENKYGKKDEYNYTVTVLDNEKPVITYNKNLTTIVGVSIDLLKDVTVSDNVDENIEVTVEGEYDFNQANTYTLYYVATDSSGNTTKEEFTLTVNEKKVTTTTTTTTVSDTTFTTSNGFTGYTKDGVTYIDGVLIANKTYSLPSNYGSGLTTETQTNFNNMQAKAKKLGLNLTIISGFRSYSRQNTIYNNYVSRDGKENADRYSARAGHSEHQTGLAIDINSLSTSFEDTEEGKWLKDNCYLYGFILRYPKDKESITGYMYEPWHFRYVGVELATKLYNNGSWITLEEYFGITSSYSS